MSEEVVAEVPAPEQAVTVAPVSEVIAPEVVETPAAKVFTQEELDAAIGKRLAREQRKWERDHALKQAAPAVPKEVPPMDQYTSHELWHPEVLLASTQAVGLACLSQGGRNPHWCSAPKPLPQ